MFRPDSYFSHRENGSERAMTEPFGRRARLPRYAIASLRDSFDSVISIRETAILV
jgi:hypothetical protein